MDKKSTEEVAEGIKTVWHLPENSYSPIRARRIYIPVQYPDKQDFVFYFTAIAGENEETAIKSIYVDGNMYDDDITVPTRP